MGLALANFLKERYLNSTDSDLGAVMSTAYDEYNNNILLSTAEKYHDAFKTETLFKNVHDLPVINIIIIHLYKKIILFIIRNKSDSVHVIKMRKSIFSIFAIINNQIRM